MTLYNFLITVKGKGGFPMDMLRRDECFPNTSQDSCGIVATDDLSDDEYVITLRTVGRFKEWLPNIERWETFGWEVVRVEAQPQ